MSRLDRAVLDTSVFIALESDRAIDPSVLPEQGFVTVITVAELQAGVLAADDLQTRARRLSTLEAVSAMVPLAVDSTAAHHWARLRVALAQAGRRANVNDLWIAAVAAAANLPVVTQDSDFDVLADLELLEVVRI